MLLHADPSLAEVPGFSREQLDALARSVELRRQQLEDDIHAYIRARQDELRGYEQEQLAHHRSMERAEIPAPASLNPAHNAPQPGAAAAGAAPDPHSPQPARAHEQEEKAKRPKHTRVQKREKELYGLVTPVFLPLLDARDTSPQPDKNEPEGQREQTSLQGDAEKSKESRKARREHQDMEGGAVAADPAKETYHVELPKKQKRTAIKKSSLRQNNSSRSRRKRVSLVIDGQTVLPADTVVEPPLTSPSETTSASNSTTSLDDMIDPRLTRHDPPEESHAEHHEAVHHSLPLDMASMHSPTKPLIETPTELSTTPPTIRSPTTTSLPYSYNPPSAALHTFLSQPSSIPATAGPEPIYADDLEIAEESEGNFHTYVGGLHGSGVDNVDQAGSYGYPSSLGASYLESYMQSRPLRVRMEAADKAGLDEHEKKTMMAAGSERHEDDEDEDFGMEIAGRGRNSHHHDDRNHRGHHHAQTDDDEMDIVGSMEGF